MGVRLCINFDPSAVAILVGTLFYTFCSSTMINSDICHQTQSVFRNIGQRFAVLGGDEPHRPRSM